MIDTVRRILVCAVLTCGSLLAACSDDESNVGDTIPPAPVQDLVVGRPLGNSLTAAWTATGDDGDSGHATYYDLRYSKEPITEETWSSALQYTALARPFSAGVFQGFQVLGLEPSTLYYFAVKTADEAGNWSSISNVESAFTTGYSDSIPPDAIGDLTVDSVTSFTISLSWTSPGDDGLSGIASIYDVRFSVLPINTEADWSASARLIGEPAPLPAGGHQSMTVTGLIPNRKFFFSIRAGDEIINWSELSKHALASTTPAEIIPPSAVTDLTVGVVTLTSVQLWWTAPGDDGDIGRASQYDIRTYNFDITEENWGNCLIIIGEPQPAIAGTAQSMTIMGLDSYRAYNLAMKTSDEIPNWSRLSNMVSFVTDGSGGGGQDTIPPGRTTDLTVVAVSQTAVTLRWRSVGDDGNFGNAMNNDLRYSTEPLTEAIWEQATSVEYVLPPRTVGTVMTMDVIDLTPGTIYYFGLKTSDEVSNVSALSNVAQAQTLP